MSESTLEAPTFAEPAIPDQPPAPEPEPWTLRAFIRAHPWWSVAFAIVVLSAILVAWARTRPSYDAYGWLVWGYQTLHLHLDLGGAPSWKPLPYLFTVPYALFGHYQLWLWMITAVSLSFAGPLFAGRIAYRLTNDEGVSRWVPIAAAVFAGGAVLGIEDYAHYVLSVQSDPIIVTFVLAAIDCHLSGKPRWAFAFGVLAGLGRPEAFPFLGLYSIWAWRRIPSMRWMLYVGWGAIVFGWFGVPVLSGNSPFVSGRLAQLSPRALHHGKIIGTLGRFTELEYLPVWLAALLAVAIAAVRRNWTVLVLAAGAVTWVIVEIAFAVHGWPGLPRYMFEAAAVACVLAGVAVGWILAWAPRLRPGLPRWVGVPVVAVLVAVLVPSAVARLRTERTDLRHERDRTAQIKRLQTTINLVGGWRHVRNCGEPGTVTGFASALAWLVKQDVGFIGYLPAKEMREKYPIVLFTPHLHGGWSVLPWHTRASQIARCRQLKAEYVLTRAQPDGALIRRR